MQAIFQQQFQSRPLSDLLSFDWIDYKVPEEEKIFASKLVKGVFENTESIDRTIKHYSRNWDISRISQVSKAILRLSIFQMMDTASNTPPKVIIDEAIRLSKKYAEDDAGRFINGILDALYKQEKNT